MATRRRLSFVTVTRRMTAELGPEFDDLVTSALWHAATIEDSTQRLADRQRAEVAWRELLGQLGQRAADQARTSSTAWGSSGLQAV